MGTSSKIVVVTGAESTGKSELTKWLAHKYKVPFIPEYARVYMETLGRKYNYSDVEIIARKQIAQLNSMKNTHQPVIFVDTWLIITKIWFEVVFNLVPEWVEHELTNTNIDLFLVCDIDLPWESDPVRENGGEMRSFLHNKYIKEIKKYKFKYKTVSGNSSLRFSNALKHLKQSGII